MAGPDDLIYSASVQDKTQTFFDRFDKNVDAISKKASDTFSKIENQAAGMGQKAGMAGGLLGGVVGGLTGAIATTVINNIAGIVDGIQNFATESAQLRARADELAVVLDVVGKNAGYSKSELAATEEQMRKTGITVLETRQSMAQWIQSNLDLEKASKVARVAQDAAVIAGTNSSEAFQRITRGIITMQPEMVRSLGLMINMEEATKKYAKANDKTTSSITLQERQQIFMNEILKQGTTITGAYEAAMTTVGKKQQSMVRIQEDLKVAFGAVFQPIMGKGIDAMSKTLTDLTKYLEEHEEELISFGEVAAEIFGKVLDVLMGIGKFLVELPGNLKKLGLGIAQLLGNLSDEELQQRGNAIGEHFKQIAALVIGFITVGVKSLGILIDAGAKNIRALQQLVTRKISFEEFKEQVVTMEEIASDMAQTTKVALVDAAKWTGALKTRSDDAAGALGREDAAARKAAQSISKLKNGVEDTADANEDFVDAMEKANESLAQFYASIQQDILEQEIQKTRDAIEAALQEAWRLEDLAAQHAEAVAQIMADAAQAQRDAMEAHAQARLDIEKQHQRKVRDIQRSFEYDAAELSRSRDAIGLMRLMRQKDRELEEAKIARDDARQDEDENYQRTLATLAKQRQKALKDLAAQEAKEEKLYQQSLKRQEQLQKLHDQWEKEDRQRQYAQKLADMMSSFEKLKGATDDGLNALYAKWETYFGDLMNLAKAKQAELEGYLNTGTGTPQASLGTSTTQTAPIGQSGLVSQILASPAMLSPSISLQNMQPLSRGRGNSSQQIDVNVSGEALDPYFQRQLVRALMEIERNRVIL